MHPAYYLDELAAELDQPVRKRYKFDTQPKFSTGSVQSEIKDGCYQPLESAQVSQVNNAILAPVAQHGVFDCPPKEPRRKSTRGRGGSAPTFRRRNQLLQYDDILASISLTSSARWSFR